MQIKLRMAYQRGGSRFPQCKAGPDSLQPIGFGFRQFADPDNIVSAADQCIAGAAIQIDVKITACAGLVGLPDRRDWIAGTHKMACRMNEKNQAGILIRRKLRQLGDVEYFGIVCKPCSVASPLQRRDISQIRQFSCMLKCRDKFRQLRTIVMQVAAVRWILLAVFPRH